MSGGQDWRAPIAYTQIEGGHLSRGLSETVLAWIADPLSLLSLQKHERLARFRRLDDRRSYLAAHALAAAAVARHTRSDATEVRIGSLCQHCGSTDHGRPIVSSHPGVHVSLSHADDYVFVGVASRPIGVDTELLGRIPAWTNEGGEECAAVAEPLVEQPFDWVRFEALVKLGYVELDDLNPETVRSLGLPTPNPGHTSTWQGHQIFDWADSRWIGTAVLAPPSTQVTFNPNPGRGFSWN
jgi:4'-phosphopantetheinyl transferase